MLRETTDNIDICDNSFLYISKKVIDLDTIEDHKHEVKVIINNQERKFKNAGNNRLSGMNVVAYIFKHVRKFEYYYDTRRNAIIITLPTSTKGYKENITPKKAYNQSRILVEEKASHTINLADSVCKPLIEYIEDQLISKIIGHVKQWHIFTESDLQAYVHKYLTRAVENDTNWLIKCNPKMHDFKAPDIVIFYNHAPKIMIELKFHMRDELPYFPHLKLKDDRNKLKKFKRKYKSIVKGYLIAVYDAKPGKAYSLKSRKDQVIGFYEEIFINVRKFDGYNYWKEKWASIHNIY